MTRFLAAAALLALLCQCGDRAGTAFPLVGGRGGGLAQGGGTGGAPGPTDPNMITLVVDPGPPSLDNPYTTGLFASATLCVPGTTTCQTIDHLLVDTGSVGVRVLESELTLALPEVTNPSGLPLSECTPFVGGTAWGPVRMADVKLGGELAANLPIQLIGENTFAMPASCTGTPITDIQTLSANGILGVGVYLQDCGAHCAPSPVRLGPNVGLYYACPSTQSCAVADVPIAQQVAHPVAAFLTDNNGVITQLPSIAASGAPSVTGLMTFGIGTQANNGLGGATVLALDAGGYIGTTFPVGKTTSYTGYVDSGSNGLFFLNAAKSSLPLCTGKNLTSFYCPASAASLGATLSSINGASATIVFSVANASRLSATAFAFNNLAGPMPGFSTNDTTVPAFDWGLPFFFGRSVYTAIEDQDTPAGSGPYFAF